MDVHINAAATKSPEADTETPIRIHHAKPISFTNGLLKRHHHNNHHFAGAPVVFTYKECLRNHAASLGGHTLDGCGEFMPSPSATSDDPTSLKCVACGCHRNFHRRDPEEHLLPPPPNHVIEYQPYHRHRPPPPPPISLGSPNSDSPPPISSSYYPCSPHMLLALSSGASRPADGGGAIVSPNSNSSSRKRFRTKFSQAQKERMYEFAERVGWRMEKKNEELVHELCTEIGVDRSVLKVWMHNNKYTVGKSDANGNRTAGEILRHGQDPNPSLGNGDNINDDDAGGGGGGGGIGQHGATNGSCSSG